LQGVSAGYDDAYWALHGDFRIGRAKDQEVVLEDHSVSRCHADVRLTDQGWMLSDHHSTNGTYLNGELLQEPGHNLAQGDVLRCGRIVLFVAELVEGYSGEAQPSQDWREDEDDRFQRAAAAADPAARTHIRPLKPIGSRKRGRTK
jgi:pSer/pThr/pTyr-binding forkhead associated (FHA) protein